MSRRRRRLVGAAIFVVVAVAAAAVFAYPMIGRWAIASRVLPKVENRLGLSVVVDDIEVRRGQARFGGIAVSADGGAPLVTLQELEVDFNFWHSLTGRVELGEARAKEMIIEVDRSNPQIDQLIERLRSSRSVATEGAESTSSSHRRVPSRLTLVGGQVKLRDSAIGVVVAAGIEKIVAGANVPIEVALRDVEIKSSVSPAVTVDSARLTTDLVTPIASAVATVAGGSVELVPGMKLSHIEGRVANDPENGGRMRLELSGSYGRAEEKLWAAQGWVDPEARAAVIDAEARDLELARLAAFIENSGVIDTDDTIIDASMHIEAGEGIAKVSGKASVKNLNFFHPYLAEKPIRNVNAVTDLQATLRPRQRTIDIERAELRLGEVAYVLQGFVQAADAEATEDDPASKPRVSFRFSVPSVPCQKVLESFPPTFVPYFAGFELDGTFAADVTLAIDWADLDATELEGAVGIDGCKVVAAPKERSAEVFKETFEHWVEVEGGQWVSFMVGPENEDFVPLAEISPHLVNSIMTTEDSRFYHHRGFIPREIRAALIKDLKAGYFRYGASSITMQLVKNIILYREKTLARKFQELFFTWYLESVLDKDRIMEIYLNVIEYGPGLYGIGPAAMEYFEKTPKELSPVEAAFFSSILPNPKKRYAQYCDGQLTRWTEGKLQRILKLMHERDRLEESEYMLAAVTPLDFAIRDDVSPRECKDRVKKFLEQRKAETQNPRKL